MAQEKGSCWAQPRGASPQAPHGQAGVGSLIKRSHLRPVSFLYSEHLRSIFPIMKSLKALAHLP